MRAAGEARQRRHLSSLRSYYFEVSSTLPTGLCKSAMPLAASDPGTRDVFSLHSCDDFAHSCDTAGRRRRHSGQASTASGHGRYAAKGVQIYVCAAKDGANEWALKGPEAELRDAQGQIFAKHYVGPSWEATDGSKIIGKVQRIPVGRILHPGVTAILRWCVLSRLPRPARA